MTALNTLVKDGHGFVGTPNLYLHKVSLLVIALWTLCLCPINIFPCLAATQNIIDSLGFHVSRFGNTLDGNFATVGTSGTVKVAAMELLPNLQQCAIKGTEPHGQRISGKYVMLIL
jgi:hypothetical protein